MKKNGFIIILEILLGLFLIIGLIGLGYLISNLNKSKSDTVEVLNIDVARYESGNYYLKGTWKYDMVVIPSDEGRTDANTLYQEINFISAMQEYHSIAILDSLKVYYDGDLAYTNGAWVNRYYQYVDFGSTWQQVDKPFYKYWIEYATPEEIPDNLFETQPPTDGETDGEEESGATVIEFTIYDSVKDGVSYPTTYQVIEGMTWSEWVTSEYNTGNYYADGTRITNDGGYYVSDRANNRVTVNIVIQAQEYVILQDGSSIF